MSKADHTRPRHQLPTPVRLLLQIRDSILPKRTCDILHQAYNFDSTGADGPVHRKGVYIWFHTRKNKRKVYVGSYFKTCLFLRTKQHLATANCMGIKKQPPRWRRSVGSTPRQLYSHMYKSGVSDLRVFPLELLPDTATQRDVLQAEQRWINRCHSICPYGYNARNAARGVDLDRLWCVGRYYSTRDMCRRVYAVQEAYMKGRLTADNHATFFNAYQTKTLIKLHTFCKHGCSVNGISATDIWGEFRVADTFPELLSSWLANVLAERMHRPAPFTHRNRKLFVCSYWTTVFDKLDFLAAFQTAATLLPEDKRSELPVVGFKYGDPLGLMFCNHATLAKHLTASGLQKIMTTPCCCERHSQWFADHGFVADSTSHILTCSAEVLKFYTGCPQGLIDLFAYGPKHRPEMFEVTMSPAVREAIVDSLEVGFNYFLQRPNSAGYSNFCIEALRLLQLQLQGPAFRDGQVFKNEHKPHEPGTEFVPWLNTYYPWLHKLQHDFVVTTADKLANNYVVVCKKHYIASLLQDLTNGQFYTEVTAAATHPDILHTVAQTLLGRVSDQQTGVADMYYTCTTTATLLELLKVVPYEAALVKLHKQPVALRFLACSGTNGLKKPAVWLTALFKCLHPDLHTKWTNLLLQAGLDWTDPPWYATRSAQVVDVVRRLNSYNMSLDDFQAGHGWHGYDVVRLYTNIDLQDLISKLSTVLDWAWACHTTTGVDPVVLVFHDTFHGCKWYDDISVVYDPIRGYGAAGAYDSNMGKGMYNSRCGKDPVKGKFYVFSKSHATAVLRLLVENSYVRFGHRVFKQTRGIPMGINPAVYMANYYLFYYEFTFIKQLVDLVVASQQTGIIVPPQPSEIPVAEVLRLLRCTTRSAVDNHTELHGMAGMFLLHMYRCTVRFVDDFTSGPNPFTASLLYETQTLMGGLLHGIYPGQFLVLDPTPGDGAFSFSTLDVRIVTEILSVEAADSTLEQVVKSHTLLFDKRRLPCYSNIPIVQYTHVASTLSVHSGYNILIGQLHRFRELITVRSNYVLEVARLLKCMQGRGYQLSLLRRKLRHHIQLYPDTFGDVRASALYSDIMAAFQELSELGSTWASDSKDWTGWDADDEELVEVSDMLSSDESDMDDASELLEV